jgi:hypothetical protein
LGLVFGSFSVAIFILLLFATSRWHHWRFGLMSSSKDREFKRHPLSFLTASSKILCHGVRAVELAINPAASA